MRRQVVASMTALTLAVLLLAGIPLAVVLQRLAESEARGVLQRQAEAIATDVATTIAAGRLLTPADLLRYVPEDDLLVLQTPDGTRVTAGTPPDGRTIGVDVNAIGGASIRLETSAGPVEARTRGALWALCLIAVATLAVAMTISRVLAGRLSEPLDRLAMSATRLGAGDFSARTPRSGMSEIDTIAEALDTAAGRIAGLVRAEREFSANASHQLRTAVTGLRLRIEALTAATDPTVVDEAEAALVQADRLIEIVEDLLRLARTGRYSDTTHFDLTALARLHVETNRPRARQAGREIRLRATEPVVAHASEGAVGQALDVLLDNALRHGFGAITVQLGRDDQRSHGTVTVSDEGPPLSTTDLGTLTTSAADPGGHGIGLQLARTLVEADGGRLDVVRSHPPTFCITVPGPPGGTGLGSAAPIP